MIATKGARVEGCRRAGADRVVQLRLARKAIILTRLGAQPTHISLRVIPTHFGHWTAASAPTKFAAAGPHAGFPLGKRHLVHASGKGRMMCTPETGTSL